MWKFKPFAQKEPAGLEGRFIDVGEIKVQVKNAIAEGGFSCVYLVKDALNASKHYALKHIICNDQESLDLVTKEIAVMKSLKGHPNVVTLYSHTIMDMGRTKEALLVMELCDKSLVNVLESRGAGFFEEKQVLALFRDVCNAVFAMHCQSPPIAHRDLKAENLLLGSDGLWKLCDFGSTSTNHKVFDKPEEMGIEEDNIRKHTTPAYRAPEMWDLFRRDLINEKVDIWALGCLLFRICYFKSAFDGESKLQVLNGNYRIPDLPKYSAAVADLIRDMLQSSPGSRPDITQVWFRVNELLPVGLQKSLPDWLPHMREAASEITEGISKTAVKTLHPFPQRSPPPVPSFGEPPRIISPLNAARSGVGGGALGAFWSTEHAKDSNVKEDKSTPKFDDEFTTLKEDKSRFEKGHLPGKASPSGRENSHTTMPRSDLNRGTERSKDIKSNSVANSENDAFNTFVAEFDTSKLNPGVAGIKSGKDDASEAEIERLREQLKQANMEKSEMTLKYEKLAAVCRSQRQEIQELKQALASRTPSPNKEFLKNHTSSSNQQSASSQKQKLEGTVWKLQQGLFDKKSTNPEPQQWQAFVDDPNSQNTSPIADSAPKSVRTRNGHPNKPNASMASTSDGWGFGNDSFSAVPAASSRISRSTGEGNSSQRFGDSKNIGSRAGSQPAGWSGF